MAQSEGCPDYIMYRIEFSFSKKGMMKYISHLDLIRLFSRALRRTGLPIKMTEGFNPHPKLSIKCALKLGVESENEEASIAFKEPVDSEYFREKLEEQLPEGIEIKYAQANIN